MSLPRRSIPLYSLYGENSVIEDTEFVHIEEIASRSRLYDWEIKPHTHGTLFQIMVIVSGPAEVHFDGENRKVSGPCLVVMPAGVVHGFHLDPKTEGKVISVATSFLEANTSPLDREILEPVLALGGIVPYQKSPGHFRTVSQLADQLHAEFRYPQVGRALIFDALLRTLLILLSRQISLKRPGSHKVSYHRSAFNRFRILVEDHFKERWEIREYAEQMCLTENRLNRICKRFTGKTAFENLQDRILLEAQRYLVYSAAPLAEIAFVLGLNDAAYFCRFFKKRTGLTPTAYREKHES
jgi:AraC family transcriptional regulator, transcriptional activator of pobA